MRTSCDGPSTAPAGERPSLGLEVAGVAVRGLRLGDVAVEKLPVLRISPDYERAGTIGEYHQDPHTRNSAELLIDCEEDRILRAVLVGMLREGQRDLG